MTITTSYAVVTDDDDLGLSPMKVTNNSVTFTTADEQKRRASRKQSLIGMTSVGK